MPDRDAPTKNTRTPGPGTADTLAPPGLSSPTIESSSPGAEPTIAAAVAVAVEETLPPPGGAAPWLPTLLDLREVNPQDYEVLREHGRGGMGRILLARDRRLGRIVAVKELLSSEEGLARRFVREALLTARLQHPSIVPVHEAGHWSSGKPFYSMKLVSGRPLHQLIEEAGTLAQRLALLPYVIAVTDAMAYAHSERIIHRDLKPANIIIGSFGETVVIDWGLAKDLNATTDEESGIRVPVTSAGASASVSVSGAVNTIMGSVVGTPGYMAPEQAAGNPADERSDVFALGAVLYATLAGQLAFAARDVSNLIQEVKDGKYLPLRQREPGVPLELTAIVDKAMAHDPKLRYPSARELADDLRRFSTGQLVKAHVYSRGELFWRWLRKHRLIVSVGGGAALILIVLGALGLVQIINERDRADHERGEAIAQRTAAESARGREATRVEELTLSQARTLLETDPTTSLAWLKRLRAVAPGAAFVASEARARGVARALLVGHEAALDAVAYSPDGKLVVTASEDGELRVWNLATTTAVVRVGHKGPVRAIQFLPDGKAFVTAGQDATVRVWPTAGGEPVVMGTSAPVEGIDVAPDGRHVASCDANDVRIWPIAGGEPQVIPGGAHRVVYSKDGARVYLRGDTGLVAVELASQAITKFAGDAAPGSARFVLSGDGQRLAAAGHGQVTIWNTATGEGTTFTDTPTVDHVAISRDGKNVATSSQDGTVRLWDVATGKFVLQSHIGEVSRDLAFSPDGHHLAATRGTMIRVWSLDTGDIRKLRGHALDVARFAFSPDSRWLVSASLDQTARLWDVTASEPRALRLGEDVDLATAVVAGSGRVAAVMTSGAVTVSDPDRSFVIQSAATQVAIAPDGKRLAIVIGNLVSIVDEGGKQIATVKHEGLVNDLVFTSEGTLVSVGDDQKIHVWDAASGKDRTFPGHDGRALHVAAVPGSRRVVTGGEDKKVMIFDLDSGKSSLVHAGYPIGDLAVSADGGVVAAAEEKERHVHLYDLATGKESVLLEKDEIAWVRFLDHDRLLVTGSPVGTLTIHDLANGQTMTLLVRGVGLRAVTTSAGLLAAVNEHGLVRIWDEPIIASGGDLAAWLNAQTEASINDRDALTGMAPEEDSMMAKVGIVLLLVLSAGMANAESPADVALSWSMKTVAGGKLRIDYTVTNDSKKSYLVQDVMLATRNDFYVLAPDAIIVMQGSQPNEARFVRGDVEPSSRPTRTDDLPPALRPLPAGEKITGSAVVALPLTSWHPYGQVPKLSGPITQAVLEVQIYPGSIEQSEASMEDGKAVLWPKHGTHSPFTLTGAVESIPTPHMR